jgi:HK97 family phage major capsid protein
MELKDIIEAGLAKQEVKLQAAIEKFEGQLKEKGSVDTEVKGEVRELSEKFKELQASMIDMAQKQTSAKGEVAHKSAAEEFVASEQYKQLVAGNTQRARIELKNTVTSNGNTVFPDQRPGVIPGSFQPLTVRQVLRAIPVTSNMVNSLREASWTNSAAEASQGSAKNESDVTFEQYNVPITTVAHWIKISNQLLADAPAVVAYIETRLRDGLAQRIEAQLINGNGTSPNLSGFTDSGNFTAYTPTSDDLLVDAINRIKYTMWAAGNMPDTVIVNPADWGAMERTREGANSGTYLYGMPGMNAGMNPFGLNVVLSQYLQAGKIIVGRMTDSAVLYNRSGAVVEMGYVDKDFTNNLITIRAEERLGLGVDRPAGVYYGDFTA